MDIAGECSLYDEFMIRVRFAYLQVIDSGAENDQLHYMDRRRGFDWLGSQHHYENK